jgi:hypothetical protein
VKDPRSLIEGAARLMAPAGRLFVSVPNRHRLPSRGVEPLDYPPHHVTRWGVGQFEHIAHDFGLLLKSVTFEEPPMSYVRLRYRRWAEQSLSPVGPRSASLAGRAVSRLLVSEWQYRRRLLSGSYRKRGMFGHTMLAEFHRLS